MSNLEHRVASFALWAFTTVVLLWGLSGILATDLWLRVGLQIPLDQMDVTARANLGSEFRFLQARELGVGLFCLGFRAEILGSRKHNLAFLAVVAAVPVARLLGMVVDGAPGPLWMGLLGTEIAMAVLLWASTRGVRRTQT